MDIATLPKNPANQSAKRRVGRGVGSGRGKTSTRGEKGSGARSGYSKRPGFEGGRTPIIRRLPKRGFIQKATGRPLPFQIVNIGQLNRAPKGEVLSLEKLQELGFISRLTQRVKLLGFGELKDAVKIEVHAASESAKNKVEKAGGSVRLVEFNQKEKN